MNWFLIIFLIIIFVLFSKFIIGTLLGLVVTGVFLAGIWILVSKIIGRL